MTAEQPGLREIFDNDRNNINAGGSDAEFGEYIVERLPLWAVPLAEKHQNPTWA
ncbi:hypothetical protein AB0F72_36125 [Actinoplanes sp. NPDC023936]|uniref:hypothetical protein n=1 Tax=Actinoplanes sp. NPDC023936 TaxID=3154910 RepID=UPI0033EB105F